MKAFRVLLALVVAGATFYSLNVLAIQNGYRDRLDFKNRHYRDQNCCDGYNRHRGFSHHNRKANENIITPVDSLNK
ncbi:hypothetical protein QWY86_07560 [Pedobacter aquatilis]|uniref:hypothetical protein n=1 Tax=Pedobacter aquatilis TaxID=351343 RepID=UPI0025B61BCB|nr:hypothetical protein [Pedobacter aquatilis]MDN3586514.1 hypothetical protein [Pedobacter aquatilis]